MISLKAIPIAFLALVPLQCCKESGNPNIRAEENKAPRREYVQVLFFAPNPDTERLFRQLEIDLLSTNVSLHLMNMHLGMIAVGIDADDTERFVEFFRNSRERRVKYREFLDEEMALVINSDTRAGK